MVPLPIAPVAAAPRAQPVARPAVPPAMVLAKMTAEEIIAEIARHAGSASATSYALGLCLRELSQPRRYRDELRYERFEDLLAARGLPARMTAHKLITVVSTFAEPEVLQLGEGEGKKRLDWRTF
jgi:hypothetical protein